MRTDNEFDIEVIGVIENPLNDNVDVFVHFSNGEDYMASFFTLSNIIDLIKKNKQTGEQANGRYFWSSDMIIVEEMTEENIRLSIEDLLETSGFYIAFEATNSKAKNRREKEIGETR